MLGCMFFSQYSSPCNISVCKVRAIYWTVLVYARYPRNSPNLFWGMYPSWRCSGHMWCQTPTFKILTELVNIYCVANSSTKPDPTNCDLMPFWGRKGTDMGYSNRQGKDIIFRPPRKPKATPIPYQDLRSIETVIVCLLMEILLHWRNKEAEPRYGLSRDE